jgi:hypothetical protein
MLKSGVRTNGELVTYWKKETSTNFEGTHGTTETGTMAQFLDYMTTMMVKLLCFLRKKKRYRYHCITRGSVKDLRPIVTKSIDFNFSSLLHMRN